MKREGRQHGHVKSHMRRRMNEDEDALRYYNDFHSHRCFQKVDSCKPTNHSKFTGKCRRARCRFCHLDPSCKSTGKTKGHRKHSSSDLLSNYRVCAWKVVDHHPSHTAVGLKLLGQSASDFISFFAEGGDYDDDDGFDETLTGKEEEEEEAEAAIHVPVLDGVIDIPVQDGVIDIPVQDGAIDIPVQQSLEEEFSTCESDSWTTENLNQDLSDLEEWCLVDDPEM